MIQDNDGIIGYEVAYYSHVRIPDFVRTYCGYCYYMPPYISRTVALTRHKKLGFTQYRSGYVGKTRICWSGFSILFVLSFFIVYATVIIHNCKFLNEPIIVTRLSKRLTQK